MADVLNIGGGPVDQSQPAQVYPKCSSCGSQPLSITITPVSFPTGMILGVSSCANCGHVFNTFPMGFQQPDVIAPPPSLIV